MTHSKKIGVNIYCIRNKQGDYWNNEWGWITLKKEDDISNFSIFTRKEKEIFNLPVKGHWELL